MARLNINHSANRVRWTPFYYDRYSNVSCGLRQKKSLDDLIPSIPEPEDLKPNRM
jgi:hypothetical protein